MMTQQQIYDLAVLRYKQMQEYAYANPDKHPYTDAGAAYRIASYEELIRVLQVDQEMVDKIAVDAGYPRKHKPEVE